MKIYISGQISNLPKSEALKHFGHAENLLKSKGHKTVNPLTHGHNNGGTWEEYMLEDIRLLFQCQAIYMLPNWEFSKGARIEHAIATELNIPIYYQGYKEPTTASQQHCITVTQ